MLGTAYSHYRRKHVDRVVAMTLKAAGLDPQAAWAPWASKLAFRVIKRRSARALSAQAA